MHLKVRCRGGHQQGVSPSLLVLSSEYWHGKLGLVCFFFNTLLNKITKSIASIFYLLCLVSYHLLDFQLSFDVTTEHIGLIFLCRTEF